MSDKVSIDYEVRDRASASLMDVNKGLRESREELGGLSGQATEWNVEAVKGSKSAGGLGASIGRLGVPIAAATAGLVALHQGLAKAVELNRELADFQAVEGDLEQSIKNTGLSAAAAEKHFESLKSEIRGVSEEVGVSVKDLSAAMRELTTQTNDAQVASENMNRVLALSHMSGMEYARVAEYLGRALQGDLSSLRRLGILSSEQISKFNGLSSTTEKVAQAMAILDEKTVGFAKGLPDSAKAAGRLDAALERLKVSFSDLIGVDQVVGGMASAIEGVTGWVEKFVEGWRQAPASIRETKREIDKLAGATSGEDVESYEFRLRLQKKEIEGIKWQAEQRRQMVKQAQLGWMQEEAALKRINEMEEEQILQVRDHRRATEYSVTAALDAKIQIAKLDQQILESTSEQARFEAETHKLVQQIAYQREREMGAAESEAERSKLRTYYELTINNLLRQRGAEWESIEKSRKKAEGDPIGDLSALVEKAQLEASAEAKAEARRQAELSWRSHIATKELEILGIRDEAERSELEHLLRMEQIEHRLSEEKITAAEAEFQRAKSLHDLQEELASQARARWEEDQARKKQAHHDLLDRLDEEHRKAQRSARQLADAFSSIGPRGAGWGAMIADMQGIHAEFENMRADGTDAMEAITGAVGAGSKSIASFAESQGASQRAINALMAATATAQGFLQLSSGNIPGSVAAFTSAAIYGANAIAGGGGSEASAPGGRGPAVQAPSREDAYRSMYQAHLQALRDARQEGRSTTIINNFSGTFLERDRTTMRRVRQTINESGRLTVG